MRPRKHDWDLIRKLYDSGHSFEDIRARVGCSTNVITRAIREDDDEYIERPTCACGLSLPCNRCLTDPEYRELSGPGFNPTVLDVD